MLFIAGEKTPGAFPIECLRTEYIVFGRARQFSLLEEWKKNDQQAKRFFSSGYNHREVDETTHNFQREVDDVIWCVDLENLDSLMRLADSLIKQGYRMTIGAGGDSFAHQANDFDDLYSLDVCAYCD